MKNFLNFAWRSKFENFNSTAKKSADFFSHFESNFEMYTAFEKLHFYSAGKLYNNWETEQLKWIPDVQNWIFIL